MQSTIQNRTIFCKDNLDILRGINTNSIDLIYLDPPFNKNKVFTAPIGSSAEGACFRDIFTEQDVKEEWVQTIKEDNEKLHNFLSGIKQIDGRQSYNFCYITYMAIRLLECHRVLKNTGSIFLHCDPKMSHYLKITLDCIFGEQNFRNEIVWYYKNASRGKYKFAHSHDIILWHSKSDSYTFNLSDILVPFESGMTEWRYTKGGQKGKAKPEGKTPDDVITLPSLNAMSKERTGYPTQKPLSLMEKIIRASTNEGDIVLDPFCGCATTCVSAEIHNRKWIGVDVSVKAYELVQHRIKKEIADEDDILKREVKVFFTTSAPKRTDSHIQYKQQKYVYIISNKAYPREYKVGITTNPKARLNSYQTSDPNRAYKIEYTIQTSKFRELEKHIHQKFENKHEWVIANLQDIKQEIKSFIK